MIDDALKIVEAGGNLSQNKMAEVIGLIMDGGCTEEQIARLLTALHTKGETVSEVVGAALAIRQRMTSIRSRHQELIDTCGTGGDGSKTFNISTAAALVTAAAGVPVAKHGNRAATSRSGSADVLAALGVNIEASLECVEACLDELGICFCFAPLWHKAMKHVAAVRKKLATPTIFNILGPLANPASAPFQLLGVGRAGLQPLMAEALIGLGIRRALVVHGRDGLDEVTLADSTLVIEVCEGRLQQFEWQPSDFGFTLTDLNEITVSGPEESAAIIKDILNNKHGTARNIVVANAAAAIFTARPSATLSECVEMANYAISSGAARDLLERLVTMTHS